MVLGRNSAWYSAGTQDLHTGKKMKPTPEFIPKIPPMMCVPSSLPGATCVLLEGLYILIRARVLCRTSRATRTSLLTLTARWIWNLILILIPLDPSRIKH